MSMSSRHRHGILLVSHVPGDDFHCASCGTSIWLLASLK